MGLKPRAFLTGSLGFVVAFVVACGGTTGLLSGQQAADLNARLNSVSSAISAGRCDSARGAAASFQSQVAALPSTVNSTLARNLGQGASTLSALASRNCSSSSTSTSRSSSTTSSSSSTSSSISTTTVTNSTSPTSSTATGTATNPAGGGTSTTSNGGAGIGGTTTVGGNQNGQ